MAEAQSGRVAEAPSGRGSEAIPTFCHFAKLFRKDIDYRIR